MKVLSQYILLFAISTAPLTASLAQSKAEGGKLPPGYPDRSETFDVLPGFKNPPPGYGEVSFYWWLGDTLTRERITWQLDQLAGRSITGLQVNYAHSDEGGNIWGLTYPSKPQLFTKEWWDLFSWFLQESKKRGMSVSLSDYTLGIAGQGWFVDDMLRENPDLAGSRLVSGVLEIPSGTSANADVPNGSLSAMVFRIENNTLVPGTGLVLPLPSTGKIKIEASAFDRKVVFVYPEKVHTSFDPMNPLSGAKVVEKFFQPFEDHCPGEAGQGLNFFFSDELNFGISGLLWNRNFAEEFKKRKGYDIVQELAALFVDIGTRTPKVRIDFNDVLVALSEENFFKPLYNWHTERGMLFGCDHGGRGLDVTEFGDYFRTQRWMSGPGCDQPFLEKNISKNKVASSISHLYERPRTWLEGYHSSGWGSSSAQVAEATFANYAMGQNLLSLHGLYYSTHGGWWEWAPPDNHFRQPYWANMADFLKCTERLSYILSQGHHRCDVAILYPVTPMVAGMEGKEAVETAFQSGNALYTSGIDFDYMDFESLDRAKIKDGELHVSGESYKILVLPAMKAIRFSTLMKAKDFYQSGGIVIAIGALPEASDRIGRDDPEILTATERIFGKDIYASASTGMVRNANSTGRGKGVFLKSSETICNEVNRWITPDFNVLSPEIKPSVLHRRIGKRDLYYVYGVPKDTICQFRVSGKVELWDPWTGAVRELPVLQSDITGTRLKMPLSQHDPQLIVFTPGKPELAVEPDVPATKGEMILVGDWEFELKPTLDNRWGDFRQPAFDGFVGAEAQNIMYKAEKATGADWSSANLNESGWDPVEPSYGPRFWRLGPLPGKTDSVRLESYLASLQVIDPAKPVVVAGKEYYWQPYEFSWRYGLKGNPGRQGYHGLKEWIHEDIFQLGIAVRDWPGVPRPRIVAEPEGSTYFLWSTVFTGTDQFAKPNIGGIMPSGVWIGGKAISLPTDRIFLTKGNNPLLLRYSEPGTSYFVFQSEEPKTSRVEQIPLSSKWYADTSVLPFDPFPSETLQAGWYRFKAPPGLTKIELSTRNKPKVWINGKEQSLIGKTPKPGIQADTSLQFWETTGGVTIAPASTVAIRLPSDPGNYGGAALPEPIRLTCKRGLIRLGDLQGDPSLNTYSGGMWYRKAITLTPALAGSSRLTLDLGDLVSSAEVFLNGRSIGKRLTPPWQFDLTGQVKAGENKLEVLIYNTLGNYYLTVPSNYRGSLRSGLIGPVKILSEKLP